MHVVAVVYFVLRGYQSHLLNKYRSGKCELASEANQSSKAR